MEPDSPTRGNRRSSILKAPRPVSARSPLQNLEANQDPMQQGDEDRTTVTRTTFKRRVSFSRTNRVQEFVLENPASVHTWGEAYEKELSPEPSALLAAQRAMVTMDPGESGQSSSFQSLMCSEIKASCVSRTTVGEGESVKVSISQSSSTLSVQLGDSAFTRAAEPSQPAEPDEDMDISAPILFTTTVPAATTPNLNKENQVDNVLPPILHQSFEKAKTGSGRYVQGFPNVRVDDEDDYEEDDVIFNDHQNPFNQTHLHDSSALDQSSSMSTCSMADVSVVVRQESADSPDLLEKSMMLLNKTQLGNVNMDVSLFPTCTPQATEFSKPSVYAGVDLTQLLSTSRAPPRGPEKADCSLGNSELPTTSIYQPGAGNTTQLNLTCMETSVDQVSGSQTTMDTTQIDVTGVHVAPDTLQESMDLTRVTAVHLPGATVRGSLSNTSAGWAGTMETTAQTSHPASHTTMDGSASRELWTSQSMNVTCVAPTSRNSLTSKDMSANQTMDFTHVAPSTFSGSTAGRDMSANQSMEFTHVAPTSLNGSAVKNTSANQSMDFTRVTLHTLPAPDSASADVSGKQRMDDSQRTKTSQNASAMMLEAGAVENLAKNGDDKAKGLSDLEDILSSKPPRDTMLFSALSRDLPPTTSADPLTLLQPSSRPAAARYPSPTADTLLYNAPSLQAAAPELCELGDMANESDSVSDPLVGTPQATLAADGGDTDTEQLMSMDESCAGYRTTISSATTCLEQPSVQDMSVVCEEPLSSCNATQNVTLYTESRESEEVEISSGTEEKTLCHETIHARDVVGNESCVIENLSISGRSRPSRGEARGNREFHLTDDKEDVTVNEQTGEISHRVRHLEMHHAPSDESVEPQLQSTTVDLNQSQELYLSPGHKKKVATVLTWPDMTESHPEPRQSIRKLQFTDGSAKRATEEPDTSPGKKMCARPFEVPEIIVTSPTLTAVYAVESSVDMDLESVEEISAESPSPGKRRSTEGEEGVVAKRSREEEPQLAAAAAAAAAEPAPEPVPEVMVVPPVLLGPPTLEEHLRELGKSARQVWRVGKLAGEQWSFFVLRGAARLSVHWDGQLRQLAFHLNPKGIPTSVKGGRMAWEFCVRLLQQRFPPARLLQLCPDVSELPALLQLHLAPSLQSISELGEGLQQVATHHIVRFHNTSVTISARSLKLLIRFSVKVDLANFEELEPEHIKIKTYVGKICKADLLDLLTTVPSDGELVPAMLEVMLGYVDTLEQCCGFTRRRH